MEALQRELTNYFRKRIDAAMKEEIANRATTEYKFHEVYSCRLPYDDVYNAEEGDTLRRIIIYAINEVIEEWRINDYDVEPYSHNGDYYGVYWN